MSRKYNIRPCKLVYLAQTVGHAATLPTYLQVRKLQLKRRQAVQDWLVPFLWPDREETQRARTCGHPLYIKLYYTYTEIPLGGEALYSNKTTKEPIQVQAMPSDRCEICHNAHIITCDSRNVIRHQQFPHYNQVIHHNTITYNKIGL